MRFSTRLVPAQGRRGIFASPSWRILQFLHAVRSRHDPVTDAELQRLLDADDQWQLLARLTPFDRAHHLRVYRLLVEDGHDDPDLLRAALLHDVGKADARGRASAIDRALHVLWGRFAPGLLARLVSRDRGRALHGLYLNCHHARLGADLARDAGASARTCELIARHEERPRDDDPQRAALVAADEMAIR